MAQHIENVKQKAVLTAYVAMELVDGIFIMRYAPLPKLEIHIAKVIVQERIAFKEGLTYPSLFDIRKVNNSTKEARDFMANEGNELVKASAMLIDSPLLRMMANFYIAVNKPKNPTQMFTDEKSAIKWLQQFKSR